MAIELLPEPLRQPSQDRVGADEALGAADQVGQFVRVDRRHRRRTGGRAGQRRYRRRTDQPEESAPAHLRGLSVSFVTAGRFGGR